MIDLILGLFRCSHRNYTWPQTDRRTHQTTVACLRCGAVLAYSWDLMKPGRKIQDPVSPEVPAIWKSPTLDEDTL